MIATILDYLSRNAWIAAALALAGAIALLFTTTAYPLTFRMSMCEVRDNTYELHDTTYRLSTVTQKEGGAIVRLCVREVVRTKQNNLVDTTGAK
jgi:hypothetical protein